MNVPAPVYGAVPPAADTVTVVVPPLQDIVPALDEATNCVGTLTVGETVTVEHPGTLTTIV